MPRAKRLRIKWGVRKWHGRGLGRRSNQKLDIARFISVDTSYHLIDDLTVYENLETPLLYKKIKGAERKSMVCDTLDRFQIVGKKSLFPSQLSGGQQQLVGVARAVVASPKLILADEPTGNLHSSQGKDVMDLLKKLNREGTTIIQVTHNEDYAAYGNRIIKLKDGWQDGEIVTEQLTGKE